jgi:hypothetical protein
MYYVLEMGIPHGTRNLDGGPAGNYRQNHGSIGLNLFM